MGRLSLVLVLLATLLLPLAVNAEGADYGVPADFVLPWACGESYRVTWEPEGHWELGKATGIGWDLGMPVGVALYAPFSGKAYFRTDLRPLETTYGHYVDIIDETGNWLVRLAHLRDPQSGERFVRTGEPIGHSGASGVTEAHLHLELLVRHGSDWVRPDLDALREVYGLSRHEFAKGAYIGRDGCLIPVEIDGQVTPSVQPAKLGETIELVVRLINQSTAPLRLDLVQVSLFSLDGDSHVAEAEGNWMLGAGERLDVRVPALPASSGTWYVGRVSWHSDQGAAGVPARGQLEVGGAPLTLVSLTGPATTPQVGDRMTLSLGIRNTSQDSLSLDGLVLEGLRPDGGRWEAVSDRRITLTPGAEAQVQVMAASQIQQVGNWQLHTLSYLQAGHHQVFARLTGDVAVEGPQLQITTFSLYSSGDMAFVLMQVTNVGTQLAAIDALELWGWKPDGESFEARLAGLAPLPAGQSALVQMQVPLETAEGIWRFVEGGYWLGGSYYVMRLPGQPVLAAQPVVASVADVYLPFRLAGKGQTAR